MKFIIVVLVGCLSSVLNVFGMSSNNYFQQIYNAAPEDTRIKFDKTTEFVRRYLSHDLVDDNYLDEVKEVVAELSIEITKKREFEISKTLSYMVNIPYRIMCEANNRNYPEKFTKSRLEIVYMNAAECCCVPIFVCGGYALSGCKEALGILSAKLGDYGANQLYDESKWQSLMDRIFYLAENKLITRDCFYTHVCPYIGQQVADAVYGDNGVPFTISQNGSPESK